MTIPDIRILGLGNVLMGDDAVGPYVVRTLDAEFEPAPGVSFIDCGTPGLDLTPYFFGATAVVIVDTVKSAGAPGDLRSYTREQIEQAPASPRTSPHDPGLKEALLAVTLADAAPGEMTLVGVIPDRVTLGPGLSPAVHAALPAIRTAVVAELARLGVTLVPRSTPLAPDLWWERAPLAEPADDQHG